MPYLSGRHVEILIDSVGILFFLAIIGSEIHSRIRFFMGIRSLFELLKPRRDKIVSILNQQVTVAGKHTFFYVVYPCDGRPMLIQRRTTLRIRYNNVAPEQEDLRRPWRP